MPSSQVDAIMGELNRVTSRLCAKIALDAHANLVRDTPIDTGWARANWIAYIGRRGAPPGRSQGRDERGRFTGTGGAAASGDVASAQSQQSAASLRVATEYDVSMGKIFVSNGVPYIERLNAGSSKQAPAGFVEAAIEKAVRQDILSFATT